LSEDQEVKGVMTAFPFLMVLAALSINGLTFLLINGPLISAVVSNESAKSTGRIDTVEAVVTHLTKSWASAVKTVDGIGPTVLLVALSLVVGFILQPIAGALGAACSMLVEMVARQWHRKADRTDAHLLFTPSIFLKEARSDFGQKLLGSRKAKLEWEWQLFNYYLSWNLSINIILACLLAARLLWPLGFWAGVFLSITAMFFLAISTTRSALMARTHEYLKKHSQ